MSDALTVHLDAELAERIRARSRETGVPPEAVVREAVEQSLFRYDDYDWGPDHDPDPEIDRRIAEETRRNGDGVPAEQALQEFRERVEARLTQRR